MRNRDFKDLDNGVQFKDAKVGEGRAASKGDRVVFDWEGYTIGENVCIIRFPKRKVGDEFVFYIQCDPSSCATPADAPTHTKR